VFDTNKFPNVDLFIKQRIAFFEPINKKFNLKIRDFLDLAYIADAPYKLVLTSKLFNPDNYSLTDNSFIFIGPSIEKRAIDDSFKFKKDENKKLIYISLGTVFNKNIEFYQKCIKAFENKKEFQVMMSIGKSLDIKELGDLPDNFFVYNYVPQIQVLNYTDIFITHGGTNSIYEALLLKNLPLIVIPQNGDQFTCAKQIEKNGAGVTLDSKNLTSEILLSTVNNFLEFKEKYKNGVNKLVESFKEARKERKKVYEKLFI
jgi:MGT family glycosyltransferase